MIELIIGGSGSGKSGYAENEALKLSCGEKQGLIYLATMEKTGSEAERRIKKHRRNRSGKGFFTVEMPFSVGSLEERLSSCDSPADPSECTVLLEALSNLLANEMFNGESRNDDFGDDDVRSDVIAGEGGSSVDSDACGRVIRDILKLSTQFGNLIIVSDDVFREGGRLNRDRCHLVYDELTEKYLESLGRVHCEVAAFADRVIEVAAGNAVIWKDVSG